MKALASRIGIPGMQSVRTGVIRAFTEDGGIVVADAAYADVEFVCRFVRTTSASAPDFQVGDSVLYVTDAEGDTGYVLGIVEAYKPKRDRLAEKFTQRGRQPAITTIEDEVVRIKADKGLVIECGSGTIIITKEGKVQIKGAEVLSRARGMNRIKGAGVNIN